MLFGSTTRRFGTISIFPSIPIATYTSAATGSLTRTICTLYDLPKKHLVEARTPIAALSTADTCVAVMLDHLPAPPLGDLAQGGDLVIDGLLIGRYADVNCGALLHNSPQMLSAPYHLGCTKNKCFMY